jgi:hypothetical protein
MPRWTRFYVTVKRPDPDKDFHGQIEEGAYCIDDDNLIEVEDATGRTLGKYPIDGDPKRKARPTFELL